MRRKTKPPSDIAPSPTDLAFFAGQLASDVKKLQNEVESLHKKSKTIDALVFWSRVSWGLWGIIGALAVFIAGLLWRRPELWLKLVKFLK